MNGGSSPGCLFTLPFLILVPITVVVVLSVPSHLLRMFRAQNRGQSVARGGTLVIFIVLLFYGTGSPGFCGNAFWLVDSGGANLGRHLLLLVVVFVFLCGKQGLAGSRFFDFLGTKRVVTSRRDMFSV